MLSDAQRVAFNFLRARARDQVPFSASDVEKEAGWGAGSFNTYKTKHLKEYVTRVASGRYTIKSQFLRLSDEEFHSIVTQSRKTVARFTRSVYDAVLKYEFLLPLTNERKLRTALDDLFYSDHLRQRAIEIGMDTLTTIVRREKGEADGEYTDRVVGKVGALLGGYSIGHVHGRFRAGGLRSHADAAIVLVERGRYLVDETTAVVRFLLPLGGSRKEHGNAFEVTKETNLDQEAYRAEADVARRLFIAFFVESVILDIHGEDEIWFSESGPEGERLYVLERPKRGKPAEPKTDTTQLNLLNTNPVDGWLRASGYTDVADRIDKIMERWRKNGVKTRRNWWEILAGDSNGKPRSVAGETFPIIASVRKQQGLRPADGAISRPKEKPVPLPRR